jgi:hypothetical protein
VEESAFDRGDNGCSFGAGDGVVDTEVVGQTGSEVGDCEGGLMGAELTEEEVERHRLVGNSGVEGWGSQSLELDGKWAMANADGDIQRGGAGAVLSGGWGSHGGVGKSFGGKGHEKKKTVKTEEPQQGVSLYRSKKSD